MYTHTIMNQLYFFLSMLCGSCFLLLGLSTGALIAVIFSPENKNTGVFLHQNYFSNFNRFFVLGHCWPYKKEYAVIKRISACVVAKSFYIKMNDRWLRFSSIKFWKKIASSSFWSFKYTCLSFSMHELKRPLVISQSFMYTF